MRMYVVLDHTGALKGRKNGGASLYRTQRYAQAYAKDEGDSVVPVEIDLTQEPLFIRGKIINGGT
jgi:hypothetical protein